MEVSHVHSTFRNQPSYTIFNKSFEYPSDPLFLQLNEIDPHFLTEAELNNKRGFLQNDVIDPRTKKDLEYPIYNYSENNKNCRIFMGGGIKSTLTKNQHESCLRVLTGWQDRKEVDERDIIVWRQMEGKLKKERRHMNEFINKFQELHKEEMYAPAKRLDEIYRKWFKEKGKILIQKHRENITFNTHTGLPHVNVCKSLNGGKAEISNVRLLDRKGWIRLLDDGEQIGWRNFNFRLLQHAENFNESMRLDEELVFKENLKRYGNGFNYFLPFESILFLLCAGDYVDLPTECLLEICNGNFNNCKIIKFDRPFPARNCGWHTKQQVVEQALMAFLSSTGRSKWLYIEDETVKIEVPQTHEVYAVNERSCVEFTPLPFESYLEKYNAKTQQLENQIKNNTALIEWQLKISDSLENLKILTTLNLPPTLNSKAEIFLAHETLKLEYKPQFGCEIMTKYELLKAWLKMRLMSFAKTTDYGFCYRLATKDCDIQLKEHLTLEAIENYLMQIYHICPTQLIANLAEFLKLLCNMPVGKYMLRYNSKYREKFLLCAPSRELTQNTVYLHSLHQGDPTDMAFMTQNPTLPIVETLCSLVHRKFRIVPCAFLPKLPHQKNLVTPSSKALWENKALQRKQAAEKLAFKLLETKIKVEQTQKRKNKRQRQRKKKASERQIQTEKEAENKMLFEF